MNPTVYTLRMGRDRQYPLPMSGTDSELWGTGARVVLVHGSLTTGPIEWEAQRPLADQGYQLVVPTRRGYTGESGEAGEDYLVDGEDVATLLGDGAHLVGHSYGGLAAIVAAAARPEAVHSLVLAEPPVFGFADHPDVTRLQEEMAQVFDHRGSDREFLTTFLGAVGTPLDELSPDLLDELTLMAPTVRRGRRPWSGQVPVGRLVDAPFPTVVVSGNHHPAWTAMCAALALKLDAEHRVVEGAGHEIQMAAEDFNAVLLSAWRHSGSGSG
jgi:pimeloyl-ACP methyl ester carboxylesterase